MGIIQKLFRKIKDGTLKEMYSELLWIIGVGKDYKYGILFYILLGLFGTAMSLCAGVLSKYIIDAVTGYNTMAIIPAAVFYISMQILRIAVNAVAGRISAKVRIHADQTLRADIYDRVMKARWEELAEFHSGDILNRVDNDVATVAAAILGWVPDLLTRIVQFAGTLGIILYYDATLALLALISAPVSVAVSGFMFKRMRAHSQKMRALSSKVMAFNEESFQNAQSIKSFGLGELYSRRLRQVQEEYRSAALEYNRFQVNTTAVLSFVGTATTVACFCWGVYRLWSGHITYGTMTLFLQMAASLSAAFSALVGMVPSMISAATAAGRIMAIDNLPQEDDSGREQAECLRRDPGKGVGVSVENVSYRYRDGETVLQKVSLAAQPGEVVALIGPSGEGKTTMLRLILGIIQPEEGQITLRSGQRQLQVSPATRSLFAYVPQKCTLFSGTVAENLRMMKADATDEELYEALRMACAENFIRRQPLGVNAPVQEQGGGFSQGQIQRLMIARALLADAPVLLLDEATSALDPKTEEQVLANIMGGRYRRTCIVTTHRPGVLDRCDRIYRISAHQVEDLTAQDIIEPKENGNGRS